MWPIFPESSARTHPSPGTSRGFVRKTSCRGAQTTVRVEFRFRAREPKLQSAVALCRGRRRQHAERFFVHLKFYRAVAGEFTVKLDGNVLLACH